MMGTRHIFIFYPAVATLRDLVGRAVSRAAKRAYLKTAMPAEKGSLIK